MVRLLPLTGRRPPTSAPDGLEGRRLAPDAHVEQAASQLVVEPDASVVSGEDVRRGQVRLGVGLVELGAGQ